MTFCRLRRKIVQVFGVFSIVLDSRPQGASSDAVGTDRIAHWPPFVAKFTERLHPDHWRSESILDEPKTLSFQIFHDWESRQRQGDIIRRLRPYGRLTSVCRARYTIRD